MPRLPITFLAPFVWIEKDLGPSVLALLKNYEDTSKEILGQTFIIVSDRLTYAETIKTFEEGAYRFSLISLSLPMQNSLILQSSGNQSASNRRKHLVHPRLMGWSVLDSFLHTYIQVDLHGPVGLHRRIRILQRLYCARPSSRCSGCEVQYNAVFCGGDYQT